MCRVSDAGHVDLSTRIRADVRKSPKNEPAVKGVPSGEPGTMGIWLASSVQQGAGETGNGAESGWRNGD
jgi:hypothetical protein